VQRKYILGVPVCLFVLINVTITNQNSLRIRRLEFTQHHLQFNSALHPSGVDKSSVSFGWDKGVDIAAFGWQATLCDPVGLWHVTAISRSGVLISITNSIYFTDTTCSTSNSEDSLRVKSQKTTYS